MVVNGTKHKDTFILKSNKAAKSKKNKKKQKKKKNNKKNAAMEVLSYSRKLTQSDTKHVREVSRTAGSGCPANFTDVHYTQIN